MTSKIELLPVTQADRDAAADAGLFLYSVAKRSAMQEGSLDDHPLVQAFARHRLSHQPQEGANTELQAEVERLREALEDLHTAFWDMASLRRLSMQLWEREKAYAAHAVGKRTRTLLTALKEQQT